MSRIIPFLNIEKIAMHGYGLGFAEGKAVFVPFTMPGDCVDVKVLLEKKDVIFGSVAEYVDASEESVLPACDAFGGDNACGGCDWLMAPYKLQLEWKTELIKQVFEPLKLSRKVRNTIASPHPQHYRNKSFLPAGNGPEGLYFGMFERYSHHVVPHKSCLLQPEVMDVILDEIKAFAHKVKLEPYNEVTGKGILRHVGIRSNQAGDEILVILVTKGSKFPFTNQLIRTLTSRFPQIKGIVQNINRSAGNVILGDEDKQLFGVAFLNDRLGGIQFRVHYKSFFQVNHGTAEKLYQHVRNLLQPQDVVLDAYCGIGSIGLCIADKVTELHGVEEVAEAFKDAEANRDSNHLTNAYFHLGRVEDLLPDLMKQYSFSAVVLDPPRKGAEASVLQAIAEHKIPQVIYVSCHPMTLERDIRQLMAMGYEVQSIQPFDMFPQTWHIETAVQLFLP